MFSPGNRCTPRQTRAAAFCAVLLLPLAGCDEIVDGNYRGEPFYYCANPKKEWLLCEDFERGTGDMRQWLTRSPFNSTNGLDDPGRVQLAGDQSKTGFYSLYLPAASGSGYQGATLGWRNCLDGEQQEPCEETGGGELMQGYPELYFRVFVKFAKNHRFVRQFLSIGGSRNDRYWSLGASGCERSGQLTIGAAMVFAPGSHRPMLESAYPGMPCLTDCSDYMPQDQYAAHCQHCAAVGLPTCPNGPRCCWDDVFAPDTPYTMPLGEWLCVEMRLKANTPNTADGVMAYWVNDKLVQSVDNMMWRSSDEVLLNRVQLKHELYPFDAEEHSNRCWFDDVVVSTQRIGCD